MEQKKNRPDTSASAVKRKRARNPRGDGGNLKDEILSAAVRLLDKSTTSQLSLRMVAREAGISPPSIYAHFSDVDVMIAEVVRLCWTQLATAIRDAADAASVEGPAAQLEASMKAYVKFAMERPSRYEILFANGLTPEASSHIRPAENVFYFFVDAVKQCQEAGFKLHFPSSDVTAIVIFSFLHGRVAIAKTAPHYGWHQMPKISESMSYFANYFLKEKWF